MLKVGITGGIGSGKSIVCQVFATLGIPVFNADDAARHLMENDTQLVHAISTLMGAEAYTNGKLNKKAISEIIYQQPDKLQQLNAIVHPATIKYASEWMKQQHAPYLIKEAAIFFETGSNSSMDVMVGVFAPIPVRLRRAMQRSQLTKEQVSSIMAKQMNEDEKMKLCNHVINNDDTAALLPQILHLHSVLCTTKGKQSKF